ncbi:hypothetical protein D3C81_1292500 [compost metagenome]
MDRLFSVLLITQLLSRPIQQDFEPGQSNSHHICRFLIREAFKVIQKYGLSLNLSQGIQHFGDCLLLLLDDEDGLRRIRLRKLIEVVCIVVLHPVFFAHLINKYTVGHSQQPRPYPVLMFRLQMNQST